MVVRASKPIMRNAISIFALCLLMLASCNGPEHKEKKFLADMQSEDYEKSNQAFNEFCMWLQNDSSTMSYDFPLMRDKMSLKAVSSADHNLRALSWITGVNDGMPSYANLLQWKDGDNFIGFCGPVDALLAGRKATIKNQASLPHRLDTIFQIDGGNFPVYLLVQSYLNTDGKYRAYTSAMHIKDISLRLLPSFFDGNEIAGNYEYNNDGSINAANLFKYDATTKTFYAYQTDDNGNILPGQFMVYQLQGDRFVKIETAE